MQISMKKIIVHTYGNHVYMKLELDSKQYEVDLYLKNNGEEIFKTIAIRKKIYKTIEKLT